MLSSRCKSAVLATALLFISVAVLDANGQIEKDLHRPACTSPRCKNTKAYLKSHYCGESPFGNGPDDGCDTRAPKKPGPGIRVSADFSCNGNDADGTSKCLQRGQPSPEIRGILIGEMRRLGLPAQADKDVSFIVWEAASPGWTLVWADYEHVSGGDLTLCQVIVVIDRSGPPHLLRKVPFQKTDADVPLVTTWFPVDIVDVDGDGQAEIILEGDAYENHWLEVFGMRDGSFKTIFSGLGYYL